MRPLWRGERAILEALRSSPGVVFSYEELHALTRSRTVPAANPQRVLAPRISRLRRESFGPAIRNVFEKGYAWIEK